MTRDDIIAMAQEAIVTHGNANPFDFRLTTVEQLEHFAALVAEAEREACALVAESYEPTCESCPSGVANAIRGRKAS
jgi:hypothetical protein